MKPRLVALNQVVVEKFEEGADGAIPIGATVYKVSPIDDDDMTADGTPGKVLGSIAVPDGATQPPKLVEAGITVKYLYVVMWDSMPGVPVGCCDYKLSTEKP